jgi:hypothetical protein
MKYSGERLITEISVKNQAVGIPDTTGREGKNKPSARLYRFDKSFMINTGK